MTAPLANLALGRALPGFTVDENYEPVPMAQGPESGRPTVIVRGTIDSDEAIEQMQAVPEVVRVWFDTPVQPFSNS